MLDSLNADYVGNMTDRFICFRTEKIYEDFREKMLIYNNIGGHLGLSIAYEGQDKIYRYNISGRKSLREVLKEQHMSEAFLMHLLKELEKVFVRGKSYMLEEENYIIHPDGLFINPEGQLGVCYLPGYGKSVQEQLCALLGYLMDCVDVNDKQGVYAVYSSIVSAREGNCTFGSLIEALEKGRDIHVDIEKQLPTVKEEVNEEDDVIKKNNKQNVFFKERIFISNEFKRKSGYVLLSLVFLAIVIYFIGI